MFDPQSPRHQPEVYKQLQQLLSPQELQAARRSTLNAHYTAPELVAAIWQAVQSLGFQAGQVLEPGCGSGNFLAAAPASARCTGVELDPVTAQIAQALYPDAEIRAESFADSPIAEDSLDLVVGNVPFGKVALHDKRHNAAGHSIHNHFLVKSMHLLRPGGAMAVITSRYTLDAQNPAARRELDSMADLLGAVRLPTAAHRQTAGTDVVTDILLLQKRQPDEPSAGLRFERSVAHPTLQIGINEYFHEHPEHVLGELELDQAEAGRLELAVRGGGELGATLRETLGRIVAAARERGHHFEAARPGQAPARPVALVESSDRPYGYLAVDGNSFTVRQQAGDVPHAVPRSQQAELRALLGLRDTAVALLQAEAASNDDSEELRTLRAQLGRRYDSYVANYGPINRFKYRQTGKTDPRTAEPKLAKLRPAQGGFRTDPFANVVYALEHFDESTQAARKATIFHERVIARPAPRLGADSPEDALTICLDTCGQVDLQAIARLLGVDEEQARTDLGELVFDEPGTGRPVAASEYLSGNVRAKLAEASAAASDDPRFVANVQALTEVQPRDLQPAEIQANLGAVWIDAAYVQQFLREILEDETVRVEHGYGSMWEVSSKHRGSVASTARWGTGHCPAVDVAKSLLEQRPIRIYSTTSDGERVFDAAATIAATEKAAEMAEHFAGWVWSDPDRATALVRTYNDRFNAIVPRDYGKIRPSLAGLSLAFRPREHQVTAVAQSLYEPAVGLFHEVGAGKTACMAMGVMEKQRLGLVNKPVVVVPNHMLEQFTREWQQLYPQARLLAASKEDLSRDRRRMFVARCATNRWDAVIMTRSAFERIPVSPATEKAYLEQEVVRLEEALVKAREQGRSLTLKRMEALKARREQRLTTLLDGMKDPGINFEQLGIDHIVADEAHAYKNLSLVSSIPGMSIEGSQRASDMDQKLWYLREVKGVRNVAVFATATPIANSISEAYTMAKFLRPDVLKDAGITTFDQWAATFGTTVTSLEVAPDGSSMRMQSRFARFHNVPELMQLWAPFANVRTRADLQLPTPELAPRPSDGKRAPEVVLVEPTPALSQFVDEIANRAERVRSRQVRPDQDNMLAITNAGRAGALDLRLTGRQADGPQKIDVAAERIAAIYEENKDRRYPGDAGELHPTPGALQLVFCDLGTPSADGRWNVYDALRQLLTERGVPSSQIKFVHEAKSDREKHELFTACRQGQVSVLIGSTEKMGVGTNVQLRAVALHHLDCPWRPADIAQREGRILRQGNDNPEIQILRYVTEQSFDAYLWQTVARKATFIEQLLHPSAEVRQLQGDVGDSALSYEEVKALASGNPMLLEHAQATADLRRLQRLEKAHHNNQGYLRRVADSGRIKIQQHEHNLEALQRARTTVRPEFSLQVGQMSFDARNRAKGNEALHEAVRNAVHSHDPRRPWRCAVGTVRGLAIEAANSWHPGTVYLGLADLPSTQFVVESGSAKLVQRLLNQIEGLDKGAAQERFQLERCKKEVERAERDCGMAFPKRAELEAVRERWQALEHALADVADRKQDSEQESPASQWETLVQQKHDGVRASLERLPGALAQRSAQLERRRELHRQAKPWMGVGQRSQQWKDTAETIDKTLQRVEQHMSLVNGLRQPACATERSAAQQLAHRRATRSAPELAKQVTTRRLDQTRELATARANATKARSPERGLGR